MPYVTAVSTILPECAEADGTRIAPIAHKHVRIGAAFASPPSLGKYDIKESIVRRLSRSGHLAIVAGMEALERGGLVSASSGWRIQPELRDDVGIVFASSFGHCEAALDGGANEKLALELCLQANVQLAEITGARALNTFTSAACASTTVALKLAANAICAGDARYILVVGADAVLDDKYNDLVGSFVALKAATDRSDGRLAFSEGRAGFVFGEGAVGLLLVADDVLAPTGASVPPETRPVELIATRIGNSAYHGTRIDLAHATAVLERVVDDAVRKRGLSDRGALARRAMYVSHETGTRICASVEMAALRSVFKEHARDLVITNTKAYSGHVMGACIEDAVAVTALRAQRAPAVDTLHLDEEFRDLTFSDGAVRAFEYAIHVAYGMGSQVAVCVYGLTTSSEPAGLSDTPVS